MSSKSASTSKKAASTFQSTATGKRTRRAIDEALKTKIVLEALKETEPINVLASRYEVHPNQISTWRKQFLANASMAFSGDKNAEKENELLREERDRYAKKVGELTMDVEFLKKNLRKLGLL
jgi:transposase-like protein